MGITGLTQHKSQTVFLDRPVFYLAVWVQTSKLLILFLPDTIFEIYIMVIKNNYSNFLVRILNFFYSFRDILSNALIAPNDL